MICVQVWRLFQLLILVSAVMASSPNVLSLPGCPEKCGDVSIPYPFGIGSRCSRDVGFNITCEGKNGLPKPLIGNIEVMNISLLSGQARVYNYLDWACYDSSGQVANSSSSINLTQRNTFLLSDTRNKFTTIGCETLGYIRGRDGYESGCVSMCSNIGSVKNGSCSGIGCCQTAIMENLDYYGVEFAARFNHSSVWEFNECSIAFVGEEDWFTFDSSGLDRSFIERNRRVPLVLDWAIRILTCEQAQRNMTSYACRSEHSKCFQSLNGPGYLCNCSHGYQGNPYLLEGCQDINECNLKEQYPCYGVCSNIPGNYSCSCPPGTHGNSYTQGGCSQNQDKFPLSLKLVVGLGISIILVLGFIFWICMVREKIKLTRLQQKYFQQNGGLLLHEQINSKQGVTFKIFTKKELERATNKFNKNEVLGRGGQGTVYRGVLEDGRTIAVKKSKIIDESQKKEFVQELLILFQINHRNVVKLLGCCLEVEVPILVYEFVSNGTLFDFIHKKDRRNPVPLNTRLKIAVESAEALAYLHSSAFPPILHGDVKSSNILLDDKYIAKVSDFGASKLVPMDEVTFATLVQGTCGYLDPEYLQTCRLSEKSDVYSFGVVLLELLTRKKAIYFEEPEEERSLAASFISMMKENRLLDILDDEVKNEANIEVLQEVAELAKQCLSVKGEERPMMKDVAEGLDKLIKFEKHLGIQHNHEVMEPFLFESSNFYTTEVTRFNSSKAEEEMFLSFQESVELNIEAEQ